MVRKSAQLRSKLDDLAVWPILFCSAALAIAPQAAAQSNPEANETDTLDPDPDDLVFQEIEVDGTSFIGGSISEFEPELVLTESDIAAYGVSSIGELLRVIEAETSSGKRSRDEPPVVLINGRRVSGFRELDNYPVEALARVEVLPEEASLAYGFQANQRVINFVLKPNLNIIPLNTRTQAPRSGGTLSNTIDLSRVVIDGGDRTSLGANYTTSSPLLESERTIVPFEPGLDQSARSLFPENTSFALNGLRSFELPAEAIGTISIRWQDQESERLTGQGALDEQLAQRIEAQSFEADFSFNSGLGKNLWSVTANYEDRHSTTDIDVSGASDPLVVTSDDEIWRVDANGSLRLWDVADRFTTLSGAIGLNGETNRSSSLFMGQSLGGELSRDQAYVQVTLNQPVPLPEGWLSLNSTGRISELSDIGQLSEWGLSAKYTPLEGLDVILSFDNAETAPSLSQLNAAVSPVFNQAVYDSLSNETVLATTIRGGNPELDIATRDTLKLGFAWKPWEERDLSFGADLISIDTANDIRTVTHPSLGFEAAFPERVERAADGTIVSFDRRAISAASTRETMLKSLFSWSIPIKAQRASKPLTAEQRRRRGGRPGASRLSLVHRWMIESKAELVVGGPTLDLLGGDSFETLLPPSRHLVDFSYYRWNQGWGFYTGLQYNSGGELRTALGKLDFSDTLRAVLSLSYEFNYADHLLDVLPILEETRLTIGVANALENTTEVRDLGGETPLLFQQDLLDPVGLGWRIELRKRF
ncbi:MAG: TonB-dependent receptor [Pseudomonadota bacterium]